VPRHGRAARGLPRPRHRGAAVTPQTLEALGPGELRNLGGVLVFVPAAVETRHLQAAINYLLMQINVRDQADQGGS
jgi:hypothetical protein